MKNTITLILLFLASFTFGQGKINIFNYTQYNLFNTLVGSNGNNNCTPSITGTNYPTPVSPGSAVTYDGYYLSGLQNPPISTWTIYTAGGGLSPQLHTSPILNNVIFANNTTWQLNKFYVKDVNGNVVNYSGESIGTTICNTPLVDYVGGPGSPNPFEAFWFVVNGETYFLIQ